MADWADVEAIRDYINSVEGLLATKPGGSKLVADFRTWYNSKNELDKLFRANSSLSEAKWYRNRANTMLGRQIPPDWIPADAGTAAETPPVAKDPTPSPPWIPTWLKWTGGVILGLGLWHMFTAPGEDDDD